MMAPAFPMTRGTCTARCFSDFCQGDSPGETSGDGFGGLGGGAFLARDFLGGHGC